MSSNSSKDQGKEALRAAEAALKRVIAEKASLEESVRERLSDHAHDIKGAIGPIMGFSQLMRGNDLAPEVVDEYLDVIQRSALRAVGICNGLLGMGTDEAGHVSGAMQVEEVDVSAMIAEVVTQFDYMATERAVNLESEVAPEFPVINTMFTPVYRCLTNLVTNAIKFTPSGGKVTISAALDDAEDAVVLVIRDSGAGIPLAQIIDILQRGKKGTSPHGDKGTGLGLNIVNSLISDLGGSFDITSESGQGTRMSLKFPRSMHQAA
ncbi:MAG: HAMP domain-containing sensor histidine kinase [Proteobacteria bacterium]|nr:HAMP domain-containing sensor histidine kinase [Pseudomonadota bacterium]